MKYEEKKFNLGKLEGISEKTITDHLKLYAGYVKHANLILEKSSDLIKDPNTQYTGLEMNRRFAFEFNGIKNHELYFSQLEEGKQELKKESKFKKAIEKQWGSFEDWIEDFKNIAATRGPGWVMLFLDEETGNFLNAWVDEHHVGVLNNVRPIFVLDMWEHAYLSDYPPAEKMEYVEAFFDNVNWSVVEKVFLNAK